MSKKPRGYYERVLIMDSETTGLALGCPDPSIDDAGNTYQAISWGFIVADSFNYKPIAELYVELKWDGVSLWNTKAEQVHGLSKQYLEEHGLTNEEAIVEILTFIYEHFGLEADPTLLVPCAGHNVSSFDIYFLRRLLNQHEVMFKTGNRFIDTNTIGMVCFETFNSEDLFELMGITRDTHNSLDDARACLKILQTTRKMCRKILQG